MSYRLVSCPYTVTMPVYRPIDRTYIPQRHRAKKMLSLKRRKLQPIIQPAPFLIL